MYDSDEIAKGIGIQCLTGMLICVSLYVFSRAHLEPLADKISLIMMVAGMIVVAMRSAFLASLVTTLPGFEFILYGTALIDCLFLSIGTLYLLHINGYINIVKLLFTP